ncbi:MAG: hypothetical protein ACOH5I_10445 [Oligoflexus sp.]
MRSSSIFVMAAGLLSSALAVSSPATVSNLQLSGDCDFDDIRVVEENGEYYIAAFFDSIYAQTDGFVTFDRKRCTMNYDIELAPHYQLDLFQFSVNGTYQLSDMGTARLTVSHRAANGPSVRTTAQYSLKAGDDYAGEFVDYTGDITRWDLKPDYQRCGARIPVESSIHVHATQPSYDQSGSTLIVMDDGTSSHYTKLCKIKYKPCY